MKVLVVCLLVVAFVPFIHSDGRAATTSSKCLIESVTSNCVWVNGEQFISKEQKALNKLRIQRLEWEH